MTKKTDLDNLFLCLQASAMRPKPQLAQRLQRQPKQQQRAVAQNGSEGGVPSNPLFANNPQFAAALQSVAARQGDEALFSAPAAAPPEEYVAVLQSHQAACPSDV